MVRPVVRLGAVLGVAAIPVLFSPLPADASSGVHYKLTLELDNGTWINGCAVSNTPGRSGSNVIGGEGAFANNPDVNNKTCSGTPSPLFSTASKAVGYLLDNGSICDSGAAGYGSSSAGSSVGCVGHAGHTYNTYGSGGWYKGQYCTASDNCGPLGYDTGSAETSNNFVF